MKMFRRKVYGKTNQVSKLLISENCIAGPSDYNAVYRIIYIVKYIVKLTEKQDVKLFYSKVFYIFHPTFTDFSVTSDISDSLK